MADKPVVGICRFSYLGVDDWIVYRRGGKRPELTDELFENVAATLYDPERLELRFWLFENLLIPSLRSQRDQDFIFIVITSPEMPADYARRLAGICESLPMIRLVVSPVRMLRDALVPELARIREETGDWPVQFRVDDDDCLSKHYVADLKHGARIMSGEKKFAISMPDTLLLTCFSFAPHAWYTWHTPFHSVGCAFYTEDERQTVFSYGHNLLPRHVTSLTMPRMYNGFMTKFDGNDSGDHVLRYKKQELERADDETVRRLKTNRFPFLAQVDFNEAPVAYLRRKETRA
ncbi:hypothetical protein D2T29_04315 [Sinirhodobacter populi]|uniref:Rhamnosyl transferase n=1 Tax=Paenirhodobacter populi TaxID=2306993 RepID=A0A443KMW0_9RHOB|nr:glycosyltransferase [Sinirhodobacter populi]RWR34130.1 hypothetical protein D2T29_04315 [Sinirhodobacter populi]